MVLGEIWGVGIMQIDYTDFSDIELIKKYGELLNEMRLRKLIRSKNVTGDLGEYIVINHYNQTKGLPKLQFAPPSTKNIDAISVDGERYSIKCTTTNTTGAFRGIPKDFSPNEIRQLFEYVVIIKLDKMYETELILQIDWPTFLKHIHWHSRIQAHTLSLSQSLIADSKVIFRK